MAKKGKKGKDVALGPQPVTTTQIIHDRTKMLCPRMGDVYSRSMNMEVILEVRLFIFLDDFFILIMFQSGCGRKISQESFGEKNGPHLSCLDETKQISQYFKYY